MTDYLIERGARATCCAGGCIAGGFDDPRCCWRDYIPNFRAALAAIPYDPKRQMIVDKVLPITTVSPNDRRD